MNIKLCKPKPPTPVNNALTPYNIPSTDPKLHLKLDANEGRVPAIDLSKLPTCDFGKYPDYEELQNRVAALFDLDLKQVLISAGGDEAIDRVCRSFLKPGRNIVFPTPSFEMIRKYALMAGAEVRCVDWSDEFPVDQVIANADRNTSVIPVVSPNNPTGATIKLPQLQRLSEMLPHCILLVDQAYAEFEDVGLEESLTNFALQNIPNAIIIRTFSKAWGLASLRVGYALGKSDLIQTLHCVGSPFPVSSFSALAASTALRTNQKTTATFIETVKTERQLLADLLNRFDLETRSSQGNFVYLEFKESRLSASLVYKALRVQGIAVRLFPEENAIRITCPGDQADFDYLQRHLKSIFSPQAILFDMDGVLVDEAPSYREAIRLTCQSFGQCFTKEDIAHLKLCGDTNNDWKFTQQLLRSRNLELNLETVKQRFEEIYQGTDSQPGIWNREVSLVNPEWLRQVAELYKLAIVTGRPRNDAVRFLDSQAITDCFSAIVCLEDGPAKPDPSNVIKALKQIDAVSAWMIGDTQDDIRAAIAAGVVPFGIVAPGDQKEFSSHQLKEAGVCMIVESLEEFGGLLP